MAKRNFPRFNTVNKVQAIAIDQVKQLPKYRFMSQAEAICDYWKLSSGTVRFIMLSIPENHAQILWEMEATNVEYT